MSEMLSGGAPSGPVGRSNTTASEGVGAGEASTDIEITPLPLYVLLALDSLNLHEVSTETPDAVLAKHSGRFHKP